MSIASELITRGWTQGHYVDHETGAVCLEGALACSLGFLPNAVGIDKCDTGYGVLQSCLPTHRPVASWNDDDDRTFDEVLRVAKEADEILGAS